ncbi:MAG TPA: bifunctional glutamate N-acetyltransferase/amino-acid acetyltransferase ArgJ [Candidatus Krumholzibacteria bacterium]|nr:bifunctional glutamate N-acetyltransferase/amino-acid acetyltransferase ArgJ [Candidatus Krumholzibacteria bacterium]
MDVVRVGVTAPKGFRAAGLHCGVKKARKDVALVVSDTPAVAAAMFTTNIVAAAPVVVGRQQMHGSPTMRAIVINSGNANACTGERGLEDAWTMVRDAAEAAGVAPSEVLVASTGVIGQYLPMENVRRGIRAAAEVLGSDGSGAAEAIRTTDTFAKETAVRCVVGDTRVTVGGMAKGSGMIAPNMATMLAFVTTDAAVTPEVLDAATRQAVDRSFHRISVDGDTSTNDMVAVLANGQAGNALIDTVGGPGYDAFYLALEHVMITLAKMIVMDGEGATKFVEIRVAGAADEQAASQAARTVANSNLVKTAIHGQDANWGRILAALGRSGAAFDPEQAEIDFGDVPILRSGYRIDFSEEAAAEVLSGRDIAVNIRLGDGPGEAVFWTCDLSKDYVDINASYRS